MKWRNQLLALFCLIVFFAFGVFYFRYWVIQKPFGIILFIAEGLDAQALAAARIQSGGADKPLTIDSLPYIALLKNHSADAAIPDPAAAATAIATGTRVRNGTIAIDSAGNPLANLLDLAREMGRTTGLITNGNLTAPTAASFYGHALEANKREDLARELVEAGNIDVVLGGGAADFMPQSIGGHRTDERDLLREIRGGGYDFVHTLMELDAIPRWRRAQVFGLFSEGELAPANGSERRNDQPSLTDMVRRGIELLQFHSGGYVLVIDVASLRRPDQEGQGERRLAELAEFDRAVAVALQYTGNKSAIFVCSDVTGPGKRARPAPEAISKQPSTHPARMQSCYVSESGKEFPVVSADPTPSPEPVGPPTVPEDVLAFGAGLGADALHGTQESTAVFEIIRDNL